ncbi:hypothetical protein C8F01DRAFT_657759 [Mycena amicta]|nr:hypothetical protein C8F01DRAFT_657759 [Mycena amicta]
MSDFTISMPHASGSRPTPVPGETELDRREARIREMLVARRQKAGANPISTQKEGDWPLVVRSTSSRSRTKNRYQPYERKAAHSASDGIPRGLTRTFTKELRIMERLSVRGRHLHAEITRTKAWLAQRSRVKTKSSTGGKQSNSIGHNVGRNSKQRGDPVHRSETGWVKSLGDETLLIARNRYHMSRKGLWPTTNFDAMVLSISDDEDESESE